jgi:hypothetical protein
VTDYISTTAFRTNEPLLWKMLVKHLSKLWGHHPRKIVIDIESTGMFRRKDGRLEFLSRPGGTVLSWNPEEVQWEWEGFKEGWYDEKDQAKV